MRVLTESNHHDIDDFDIDWDKRTDSVSGRKNGKLAFLIDDVSDVIDLEEIDYFGDDESLFEYLTDNGLWYRGF